LYGLLAFRTRGYRLSGTNVPIYRKPIRPRCRISQVSIRHLGPSLTSFLARLLSLAVNRYGRVRIYSLFRIVPGDVFVSDFASDRSHMVSGVRFYRSSFQIRIRAWYRYGRRQSFLVAHSFVRSRPRDGTLCAQCVIAHISSVRGPFYSISYLCAIFPDYVLCNR